METQRYKAVKLMVIRRIARHVQDRGHSFGAMVTTS